MNWIEFCTDNHIHYVTRGPNTKRGEISVKCPWCGDEDPSEHLGINLTTDYWGCHRNQAHRGKSVTYLIKGLLGCSQAQAKLVVAQYDRADPETLDQALASLSDTAIEPQAKVESLHLPPEFRGVHWDGGGIRFCRYLIKRGFPDPEKVAHVYKLRYCNIGRWKDRLIFPIYQNGKLVAWTGRALGNPVSAPRYLSTSNSIKTTIFNEDEIFLGGKILFITEGPIDAIKVDYFGRLLGAKATCVFGTSITIDQIGILKQVSKKFKKTILLLDPDAIETSFNVLEWLPNLIMGHVPDEVDDPGDLTAQQVVTLVKSML